MNGVQTSDYMIFFDDVRVDGYISKWGSNLGLNASDASATITMFRTDEIDDWRAYLTQVRIFTKNIFTGKFLQVFEGEIVGRSWNKSRRNMGQVTFQAKGYFHWLETPIPLMIDNQEKFSQLQRFIYEAHNIDVDAIDGMLTSQRETLLKDKTLKEIIQFLFEKLNKGYYNITESDSAFAWSRIDDRFNVMVDIMKEFRQAGFMDMFTFVKSTQIKTFYVFLNEVLEQMMFEFYQDRDGSFRVKNPSWKDDIPKYNILDESVVRSVSGMDRWESEPTRVLTKGGQTDLAPEGTGGGQGGYNMITHVPVGLYIGNMDQGEYFSQTLQMYAMNYGLDSGQMFAQMQGMGNMNGAWSDTLTDEYPVTSKHSSQNPSRPSHNGTDYGLPHGTPVYNVGTYGTVTVKMYNGSAGHTIDVDQNINGTNYTFRYFHMSEVSVKSGQSVSPGDKIGLSGGRQGADGAGNSRGPHLHFEIWRGGRDSGSDLNPETFLREQGAAIKESAQMTASGGDWETYEATSYDAFCGAVTENGYSYTGCTGVTSTGIDVSEKHTYEGMRIIAVDPDDIPYYSIVEISDQGKRFKAIALDTGGAIKSSRAASGMKRIDLLAPSREAAFDFGRHNVQLRVVRKGKGDGSGTPYADSQSSKQKSAYAGVDKFQHAPSQAARVGGSWRSTFTNDEPEPVTYDNNDSLRYYMPSRGQPVEDVIASHPSGISANLIASVIGVTSAFRSNYEATNYKGIMALHKSYIKNAAPNKNHSDGTTNIKEGARFLKNAMDNFNGKVTFALAAYRAGSFLPVQNAAEKSGKLEFAEVREILKEDGQEHIVSFVDEVIDTYANLYSADYIKGDPHKDYGGSYRKGVTHEGESRLIYDENSDIASENTELPEFENSYKPVMSDEERRFKVNLRIVEQNLIRRDSPAVSNDNKFSADELVFRYSKYMMQVFRAKSHNVDVSLSTAIPSIRPGFNAWLEPSSQDLVFYVTSVSHQGSFEQGCYTNVSGGFVRDSSDYDDIDDSIFIGEHHYSAEDLGKVVKKKDFQLMRNKLKNLNRGEGETKQAENFSMLKDLYSPGEADTNVYISDLASKELTEGEVESRMKRMFNAAPPVIQERKKEIKEVIEASEDILLEKLLFQKRR